MGKLLEDREFRAGTTGWTESDLDDPEIAKIWETHRYEIVEGVLAEMPPAYYEGSVPLERLKRVVDAYLTRKQIDADWGGEIDLVLGASRITRPDAMLILKEDARRQVEAAKRRRSKLKYGRMCVAPTLIVESVSVGHEQHDRALKRGWYAEFGLTNFWILDAFKQTLECLMLDGTTYKLDVMGRKNETIRPKAFPGLVIPLKTLWV